MMSTTVASSLGSITFLVTFCLFSMATPNYASSCYSIDLKAVCDNHRGEKHWECNTCSDALGYPKCPLGAATSIGITKHAVQKRMDGCGERAGHKCSFVTDCDIINSYGTVAAIHAFNIRLNYQGDLFGRDFPPTRSRKGLPKSQPERSLQFYDYRKMDTIEFRFAATGMHAPFRPDAKYYFIVRGDDKFAIRLFSIPEGPQFPLPGHSSMLSEQDYLDSKAGRLVILYAGEFWTDAHGKIKRWSNGSGHFKPQACCAAKFGRFWGFPEGEGAFKDAADVKTTGDIYDKEKYKKLLKLSGRREAVVQRMKQDGLPLEVINYFEKEGKFLAKQGYDNSLNALEDNYMGQDFEFLQEKEREDQKIMMRHFDYDEAYDVALRQAMESVYRRKRKGRH